MKNILRLSLIVLLVCSTAGCKKELDADYSISRINLHGVKYLALGAANSDTKGGSQSMLYSIDENGNMQLVAYEYDCDEEGLVTELSRNIGITVNQIVPVGDKYIWLVGCRYVCNDYSGFSESMQRRIRGMVDHSVEYGLGFLIRKSDGKIFETNFNGLPVETFNVPGYGNIGLVCNNGLPVEGEISADRLRKLGLINQVGGDIYLTSGSWLGSLTKLKDNGNSISVINVFLANVAYAITDNDQHLGTVLSYSGNSPQVPSIMAPDGTLPAIQGIPTAGMESTYWPEMRCINGKFFVSVRVNPWDGERYDSIYRVDINGSQASATAVAEGYFSHDESETFSTTVYVSDEENYSWVNGTSLFTFNANTYLLTENTLPEGWPQYSLYDAEGHYYKPHLSPDLQSFTIYDLATLQTEQVTCDRSQVPAFNLHKGCEYDGGLKAFIESVFMADGSTCTIVTPVTGPDRGVSRLESQTEANNNVVVTTLIPLN